MFKMHKIVCAHFWPCKIYSSILFPNNNQCHEYYLFSVSTGKFVHTTGACASSCTNKNSWYWDLPTGAEAIPFDTQCSNQEKLRHCHSVRMRERWPLVKTSVRSCVQGRCSLVETLALHDCMLHILINLPSQCV